jgi:predicted XRE-type DNA-binding protein
MIPLPASNSPLPATSLPIYCWGATQLIKGKDKPWDVNEPNVFAVAKGSLLDLANHIGQGFAWMPAILDPGQRRRQQFCNYAELLALDIDDGMTIPEALGNPLIVAHCGLGIESNSSKPERHKFRLVFPLAEPLTGYADIKLATIYLQEIIGTADAACKDASRFYYGAEGRSPFLVNHGAKLPYDFLDRAKSWQDAKNAEKEAQRLAAAEKRARERERIEAVGDIDLVQLVEDAEQILAWDAFLPYLDAEEPKADKARCVPAFRVGSGSRSAFVSATGDKIFYHDPNSGEKALSGFWFWARVTGRGEKLKGEAWASAAKDFCALAGIHVPDKEWQPAIYYPRPTVPTLKDRVMDFLQAFEAMAQEVEFKPGERIQTYRTLAETGAKVILDRSATGSGKSYDSGNLDPDDLGAKKLIYGSNDHRNPTTPTLADWYDLEARHGGLVQETAPDGSTILRRAKPGQAYTTVPNCSRTGTIAALRNANVSGADSAALVCGGCPLKEACQGFEGGNGFGYLGQKRRTLGRHRLRAHPDSLPSVTEFDYSDTAIVIDEEVAIRTVKTVDVTLDDLARTMADLRGVEGVEPTLDVLYSLMERTDLPRFGLSHDEITGLVPVATIDLLTLDGLLQPDLGFLNPTAEHGIDLTDLPQKLRRHYAADAEAQAKKIAKVWFADFLRILNGSIPGGTVRLDWSGLHLTLPDHTLRSKLNAARVTVIQDATISPADLALKLGIPVETIAVCRQQETDHGNLRRMQVTDIGAMTRHRGADQEKRAAAIVAHYQNIDPTTLVIDFKGSGADGSWWTDSRGSNAMQGAKTLILCGTPYENLGDALSRYCAELGTVVGIDDPGFTQWIKRKVHATIKQGEGRLRANRRGGEELTVILLSDFEMPGYEQIEGRAITPDAGTKPQRLMESIKSVAVEMVIAGQKVTQSAIAAALEISQGRVSQVLGEFCEGWAGFKKLLILLLDPGSEINNLPPGVEADEITTVAQAIELAEPEEILPLASGIATGYGWLGLAAAIQLIPRVKRDQILTTILALMGIPPRLLPAIGT